MELKLKVGFYLHLATHLLAFPLIIACFWPLELLENDIGRKDASGASQALLAIGLIHTPMVRINLLLDAGTTTHSKSWPGPMRKSPPFRLRMMRKTHPFRSKWCGKLLFLASLMMRKTPPLKGQMMWKPLPFSVQNERKPPAFNVQMMWKHAPVKPSTYPDEVWHSCT